MNRNLYVVYTPYQLISCLNIINERKSDKNVVLLVHKNLTDYKDLCQQIYGTQVFLCECFFYTHKKYKNKYIHYLFILYNLLKFKYRCKKLGYLQVVYNALFVPSDEAISRVIFDFCKKINSNIELNLYDDGIGTYELNTFSEKTKLTKFVYNIVTRAELCKNILNIYVYKPFLLNNLPLGIHVNSINSSNEVKEILKNHIGDKVDSYLGKKIIFLDQGFANDSIISQSLSVLTKYYNKNEILVKLHPRISSDSYGDLEAIKDNIPFEIIAISCNLNDCLIITSYSGGCITPCLIYKQKLNVMILLGIDSSKSNHPALSFFNKINNLFKNNVDIPKNFSEFENILKAKTVKIGVTR